MENYKEQINAEIFDLALKKALIEDCERELHVIDAGKDEAEHVLSDALQKSIRRIGRRLARQLKRANSRITLPRSAAAVFALLLCAAVLMNTPVGAVVKAYIAKVTAILTQYEFHSDETITQKNFNTEIRPGYMPEGYRLRFVSYRIVEISLTYESDDDDIYIDYGIANATEFFIDNEHSVSHDVLVNNNDAVFYQSTDTERPSYLVWSEKGYCFMLTAYIEEHDIVKIAESIKIS